MSAPKSSRSVASIAGEPSALTGFTGLLSLYSMLVKYAEYYVNSYRGLQTFQDNYQHDPSSDSIISDNDLKDLNFALEFTVTAAGLLQMDGTELLASELLRHARIIRRKHAVAAKLSSIQSVMMKELSERKFLNVPHERVAFYDNKDLCGELVSKKFPAAIPEIIEAGNCYALERPTACVFHLMRVISYGIAALSHSLKVKFTVSIECLTWNELIERIEKAVRELAKLPRSSQKRKDQKYYSEIVQHLCFCKDAWRNHVSHSADRYDMPQAKSVLDHTALVMKLLSERIKRPITKLN